MRLFTAKVFLTGIGFYLCVSYNLTAQTYVSEQSTTTFFSSALLEDIKATNSKGRSVFNSDNGEIVFSIPINEFQFRKSLMQEHFNEKYLESDKFPKSVFKGKIYGFKKGAVNEEVLAEGKLEIHGVEKEISVKGRLDWVGEKVILNCVFIVKVADFDIEIPSVMFQNIAEEVEVTLDYEYKANE